MSDSHTTSLPHPKALNASNGFEWKRVMEPLLMAKGYHDHITDRAAAMEDPKLDKKVKGYILVNVEVALHSQVPVGATAFATWSALCSKFEHVSHQVKANTLLAIRRMHYTDDQDMDDHLARCRKYYQQLDAVGVKMDEEVRVIFLLGSLPASWDNFQTSVTAAWSTTSPATTVDGICSSILQERDRRRFRQQSTTALIDPPTVYAAVQRSPETPTKATCSWCQHKGHEESECRGKARGLPRASPRIDRRSHAHVAASESPAPHYFFTAMTAPPPDATAWYIDSGASTHICSKADLVHSLTRMAMPDIVSATGACTPVHGRGSVDISLPSTDGSTLGPLVTLTNVSLAPGLAANLISVARLTAAGLDVRFTANQCVIRQGRRVLAVADLAPQINLYRLRTAPTPPASLATLPTCFAAGSVSTQPQSMLWHRRLAHAHHGSVCMLFRLGMAADVRRTISPSTEHCAPCALGKHHRTAVPTTTDVRRADRPLQRLHIDICGPFPPGLDGSVYLLQIVDDYSRYTWARSMPNHKAETVLSHLEHYVTSAEAAHPGDRVSILRSDNGTELLSKLVSDWLAARGIERELTATYTPHQNGVVERMNRVTAEQGRAILIGAGLPDRFWPLAFDTAVYCRNRCPTSTLDKCTPYEAWTGEKPKIGHMRVFGCLAYAHVRKAVRTKLDATGIPCVFVGYTPNSSAYRLWNPADDTLIDSRDVYFVEDQLGGAARGVSIISAPAASPLPLLPRVTPPPLIDDDLSDYLPDGGTAAASAHPAACRPPASCSWPCSSQQRHSTGSRTNCSTGTTSEPRAA